MYEDFLRTILRLELVNRPRQNTAETSDLTVISSTWLGQEHA